MPILYVVLIGVAALVVGVIGGYVVRLLLDRRSGQGAKAVTDSARREAEALVKEARITAKEETLRAKEEFERSTSERRQELKKIEQRLDTRETNIERKADLLESRGRELDERDKQFRVREEELGKKAEKLETALQRQAAELERIGALTREEARQQLLDKLNSELEADRGAVIRRFHEETQQRLHREAQEIMVTAMERYAGDCAYERTTSTIPLPNDEMKGRIIGREGRNIRAIEAATGVSVLIDDTPEAVVISCFDPVRRVIARIAMERLVADGRIHPTRIEEMVAKVKKDVEAEMMKAGQDAVEGLGLTNVRQSLIKLLGRLKYRYSYSQNVLQHSIECAYFMGSIAAQLGLDVQKAKRAGLFHDIGKAVDHEVEGSHAAIGADLLKRNGECEEVANAAASHHEETERQSLYGVLASVCDTLSAGRPGARAETTELYLRRIEQIETIGAAVPGVETCYAIQAGRELRVIVMPEAVDENRAAVMAREIAGRIENDVQYPGQVKVTVVRETRAVEYAK